MRFLAFDLGDKRTGLALGDDESRLVSPAGVIESPMAHDGGATLLAALAKAVEEYGPDELVVGLPLNMDDSEGPQAKKMREFGARLGERVGLPVHFQDERLTTDAAHWEMAGSGMTRGKKKGMRDAIAAAGILREFLGGRRGGAQE